MATCDDTWRARSWREKRQRWLAPLLAVLVLATLVGAIAGFPPGRLAWLAGGSSTVAAVTWCAALGYAAFLRRTDRVWIATMRSAAAEELYDETRERLGAGWGHRRAAILPEAVAACCDWLVGPGAGLPVGDRRELIVWLSAVVRQGGDCTSAGVAMDRLRRLLMELDRGRGDPRMEPDD